MIMSKRGNDLVRRYLWMAALSAAQHNPAVKPLYQRVRAKHPDQPSVAIGHVMRKLLHLALAVWKSGKPATTTRSALSALDCCCFDPEHYPWDKPAHLQPKPESDSVAPAAPAAPAGPAAPAQHRTTRKQSAQAAGHKNPVQPERSVVTAACGSTSVPQASAAGNAQPNVKIGDSPPQAPTSDITMSLPMPRGPVAPVASPWIDFDHLKSQLPLGRVLQHLGVLATLRGTTSQRRGPCPVHANTGPRQGRTFSVQLDANVFQCFDPKCGIKGDVIDLWAAVKRMKLRDAAVELVTLFNLEPAPVTEKRHG
jgi:hypothetical protein